jgi:hypothetical protein
MLPTIFTKKDRGHLIKKGNVVFFNANGTDTSALALKVATLVSSVETKSIIVEFPCVSIPRLALQFGIDTIDKHTTIDQLLIDYERRDLKSIFDYIVKTERVDFIPINPKNKPDAPTILKLNEQKTLLDIPFFIKNELANDYSLIFYVLQGQLMNPMTFFSIRSADLIVMNMNDDSELPWSYAIFKKLVDDYGVDKGRIVLFTEKMNHEFKEQEVITKLTDIIKKIPVTSGEA